MKQGRQIQSIPATQYEELVALGLHQRQPARRHSPQDPNAMQSFSRDNCQTSSGLKKNQQKRFKKKVITHLSLPTKEPP